MTQIVRARDLDIDMYEVEGEGYRVTINGDSVDHLDLSTPMPLKTANIIIEMLIRLAIVGEEEGTNSVH